MAIYLGGSVAITVQFGGHKAKRAHFGGSTVLFGNDIQRLNASIRLYGEWSDYKLGFGRKHFSWAWLKGEALGQDQQLDSLASYWRLEAVRWEPNAGGEYDAPVEDFYYQWHEKNPQAPFAEKLKRGTAGFDPVAETFEGSNPYEYTLGGLRHSTLYEARLTALSEKWDPLVVSDPVFFVIPYIDKPIY